MKRLLLASVLLSGCAVPYTMDSTAMDREVAAELGVDPSPVSTVYLRWRPWHQPGYGMVLGYYDPNTNTIQVVSGVGIKQKLRHELLHKYGVHHE